ncbi:YdcF family protein [Aliiroseovarius sp. CAU 1755]
MTRVAIVLGAAVRPDGGPSPALQRRADTAAQLYLSGVVDQIVASGGVPKAGVSEAELIYEICVQAGVPASAISCESQSSNTLENIRFSLPLLPPGAQITLVTDRHHAPRAGLIAREMGVSVQVKSPALGQLSWRKRLRVYLREGAALALYATRRMGRTISRRSP